MTTDKDRAEILSKAEVRLCRLHPWSNFPGFGFTLEPSLGPPHRTCMVESNSPAEAGGLRIRDVILAVNNQKMSDTDFNQIQTMIKEAYNQNTRIDLLVIKQKSYELVEKRKIKIDQASATVIDAPAKMPDSYKNFPDLTPRICSICISENETVFGFDLTSGVNKIGLYVQKVYPNTQAEHSGLRNNDRIIEVNGQNIDEKSSRSSKKKVRELMKTNALIFLVADTKTYEHYKRNNLKFVAADAKIANPMILLPPASSSKRNRRHANDYSGTVQCRSGDLTKEQSKLGLTQNLGLKFVFEPYDIFRFSFHYSNAVAK
ncbi:unnamed protein product [Adineta ricciae]|uniref:PDZ domain-containing protein n=1 Tax=Adineta ricciae TaxID=249248 RepID=A0A816GSY1_ADIRI|nr:unnamed protein product [Adineta ricciae]